MYEDPPWLGQTHKKSFEIIFLYNSKKCISPRLKFWKILSNNQIKPICALCQNFHRGKSGGGAEPPAPTPSGAVLEAREKDSLKIDFRSFMYLPFEISSAPVTFAFGKELLIVFFSFSYQYTEGHYQRELNATHFDIFLC